MAERKPTEPTVDPSVVHPSTVPPGAMPFEAAQAAPPERKVVTLTQAFDAHVGDTVAMNGREFNMASGSYNWWATAPNGREVQLTNPTMPGASCVVDQEGDYKFYVDTDDGQAVLTVHVTKAVVKE